MTIEAMETKLDAMVQEALRRKSRQLDIAGASKTERAAAMAKTRAELKRWRDAAPACVLRLAVEGG
ncbi:hypothetical protein ASE63_18505 [Bosea sp. Root381]|uniref:hypothetical protein n=1 Tax=Bosea sp. Root381 TaxID=1736524 RepID=UPI0006FEB398|nr:hypothetical protein [Bosea sp. Root381]KRE13465.1 hypothetical protein ASE63_18505 [Bosea sp. Root381]